MGRYLVQLFDKQTEIIKSQQQTIDELEKYKDKYFEYKNKYESLLVFGVIDKNEKLKRKSKWVLMKK